MTQTKSPLDTRRAEPDPARAQRFTAIEHREAAQRGPRAKALRRRPRDEDPALRAARFAAVERRSER